MAPRTPQEIARHYLELLKKAKTWKAHLEILSAWHAKHLRAVYDKKENLLEALKAHHVKV